MSETTICLRCGAEITDNAIANYYRCEGCLAELRNRGAAFIQSDNLLVRASYSPGFATDLTGWSTDIQRDGSLTQNIKWDKQAHGNTKPHVLSASIPGSAVQKVADKLRAIDVRGISILFRSISIDDAPFVHLFSPDVGIHFSVTLWDFDNPVPDRARSAAESFFDTWDLIDSLSPLTVKRHRSSSRTTR